MSLIMVRVLLPLLGLAGPALVLMGLPGTWILLALAGLSEWVTTSQLFSTATWIAVLCVAIAGEVWETLSSARRARKAGAGRRGAWGALLGGIGGALVGTFAIPIPVLGTLLGGATGAFALSAILERAGGKSTGEAARIGRSAAAGQLVALLGKLLASVVVYIWLVVAIFA